MRRRTRTRRGLVFAIMCAGTALSLRSAIASAIERSVEVFDVEASAPYYFESEDEVAKVYSWEVVGPRFDVVASDDDFVTVAFQVAVTATFEASFVLGARQHRRG